MSYYVDPEEEGGELQKEVEREDGKVSVLAAFPDFTLDEMRMLARGLDRRLKIPEKTPWSGVVSPDGRTILWEKQGKATAKEYREAYDAEAKKLGKALPRAEWKRALGLVERSVAAEVDERWKDAVLPLKEVHAAAAEYPPALRGRIEGQIEAIQAARDRLREEAEKTKDPAARAKAVAAVDAAFEGLPALGSAPAKDSTPR
jgi:hypothetical protein